MNPFETAVSRVGFLILVQRCTYKNYKNLLRFRVWMWILQCWDFPIDTSSPACRM